MPDREGLRDPLPHALDAGERDVVIELVAQPLKLDDALTHTVPVGLCDTDPEKDNELLALGQPEPLLVANDDFVADVHCEIERLPLAEVVKLDVGDTDTVTLALLEIETSADTVFVTDAEIAPEREPRFVSDTEPLLQPVAVIVDVEDKQRDIVEQGLTLVVAHIEEHTVGDGVGLETTEIEPVSEAVGVVVRATQGDG